MKAGLALEARRFPRSFALKLTCPFALCAAVALAGCGSNGSGKDGSPTNDAGTSGTNTMTTGGSSAGGSGATGGGSCTEVADPSEMVSVPAGDFPMGCNAAVDKDCADDEKPQHTVTLSAFEIDRTEVTQAQYTACVLAGSCEPAACDWSCDKTTYPASCVTWSQANSYCAWAQKRLPTEAEWEKAARGADGNKYPWGNGEPTCDLANIAGCNDGAVAVGSLSAGASPYGALDMAGNMVEFVADWYDEKYYADSPAADPTGPATGKRYGGRGGGYKSDADFVRTSKRDWYDSTDNAPSLGFRCAR